MSWPKGKPRAEGVGRKKGTPNKKTQSLMELCDSGGFTPFEDMLKLTHHPDPELSFHALKEVCQYLYPKRKALEHSGPDGGPIETKDVLDERTDEELIKMVKQIVKDK